MSARPASLPTSPDSGGGSIPRHVAIIMDGNGRWAGKRHLPRVAGHREGVEAVRRVTRAARDLGVEVLTLYAFSSENWRRPEDEIRDLMGLLRRFIREHLDEIAADNIRLKVIGDQSRFPADVQAMVADAVARCAVNSGPMLVIALGYGARAEIGDAVRRLAERARNGLLDPAAIDEAMIDGELATAGLPPLDLLIRTSGEQRLSNFLLWQVAYAELIFTDVLWPDFDAGELRRCIDEFGRRERRFGGL